MIKTVNLTKRFASFLAVDGVSFEVQRGEIAGLLGPNGAGKTTILRILAGYLAATEGTVLIDGLDVCTQSLEVRRRIGYLPENAALYPEMRVDEYLSFRSKLKGVPSRKRRRRLDAVKENCGLQDAGRRIIGQLSRGFCQRVGLADSLIHEPELLILDEPTIGLDPNQIREVRELIKELGRKFTILLSTHFLAEAEMICRRVLILNRGRLVASDTPAALAGLMQGGHGVKAEILGPPEQVTDRLARLAGVRRVTVKSGGEAAPGGSAIWNGYTLECEPDADPRAEIFAVVAGNRWALRELKLERRNLEDAFSAITKSADEGNYG